IDTWRKTRDLIRRAGVFPPDQGGGMAPGPSAFAVAARAALIDKQRGAFFGRSLPLRQLLSSGADRDVPSLDLVRGWRPADAVSRRLRDADLADPEDRRHNEKVTPVHCERSHRLPPARAAPNCPPPESAPFLPAGSSISRYRPSSVAPCPARPC